MFVKSLAKTGVSYRRMQARRWSGAYLHFQIMGEELNRPYGAAFTVSAPEDILNAIDNASEKTKSLAGSGAEYAVVQAKQVGNDRLHVQVAGSTGNRGYGAAFEVTTSVDLDPLF